jgi:hypothetical protein
MRLGLKWSASPADHAFDQILHGNIIGTLTGGIAHDFNNILAALIGYVDLGSQILAFGRQHEQKKSPIFVLKPMIKSDIPGIMRKVLDEGES